MSASSTNTFETESALAGQDYLPTLNPAMATVEEVDDWLTAQGARVLTATELRDFVRKVRWSNVPGENPGDPDFPFGAVGRG